MCTPRFLSPAALAGGFETEALAAMFRGKRCPVPQPNLLPLWSAGLNKLRCFSKGSSSSVGDSSVLLLYEGKLEGSLWTHSALCAWLERAAGPN